MNFSENIFIFNMTISKNIKCTYKWKSMTIRGLISIKTVTEVKKIAQFRLCPILGDKSHFRHFVAGLQFHDRPILLRCSATRAESSSTLRTSSGSVWA